MQAKHYFVLMMLFTLVPAGIMRAKKDQFFRDVCFFLLVLGTIHHYLVGIHFISREWYRGTTLGIEVCWLDFLWMILLGDELRNKRRGRAGMPTGTSVMILYIVYCIINVLLNEPKLFGFFEITKQLRGLGLFLAVAFHVKGERELRTFAYALAVALSLESVIALKTRLQGNERAPGTFAHANTLSMYNLTAVPVIAAIGMSNVNPRLRMLATFGAICGSVSVILSISRAGLVTLIVVWAVLGQLCGAFKITPKKIAVAFAVILACIPVAMKVLPNFQKRMGAEKGMAEEFGGSKTEGRAVYITLAKIIEADRPLGCGLNNWSYCVTNRYAPEVGQQYIPYLNTDDPPSDRGTLKKVDSPQAPPGHSLYAITLGETGWIGVILLANVWIRWYRLATPFLWKRSDEMISRLGTGLVIGFFGSTMQNISEWEFRQTPMWFLVHILAGVAAAIYPVRPEVMARRARQAA